jgi:hypothetical protein
LHEAFGRLAAFLLGRTELTIIRASALGAIATKDSAIVFEQERFFLAAGAAYRHRYGPWLRRSLARRCVICIPGMVRIEPGFLG